jgi:molecular chaperone DnaJ
MAKRDFYEVLGVQKNASREEIKKAYCQLAIKHHPDRNPENKDSEEKFKEATEAYEILADDRKRQAYDQYGFAGLSGMGQPTAQDFSSIFQGFEDIFGDVSGIFDSFFGGGSSRRRSGGRAGGQRGSDLRYDMEITFLEAAFGARKEVSYPRAERCEACRGTGADKGSGRKLCPTCGGSGQVRRNSGFFSIASTCPSCNGEGEIIEKPCAECRGAGTVRRTRTLTISIPAGIEDGKRLSVSGQGDAGINGSQDGDLYVFLRVQPHESFERDGRDVYCAVPISITQAALGADIVVPTLDDKTVRVSIPPGTQNGRILRLRGEGIPELHNPGKRGDMYIKIVVRVPTKITPKAKELLKELASVSGEDTSPRPIPLSELKQ